MYEVILFTKDDNYVTSTSFNAAKAVAEAHVKLCEEDNDEFLNEPPADEEVDKLYSMYDTEASRLNRDYAMSISKMMTSQGLYILTNADGKIAGVLRPIPRGAY